MDARYSRQLALPGFGAPAQSLLATARVLVIGAGGLGSTVIPALAGAGVGTLTIVDDDTVELSNLHRQHVHAVSDIGRGKAVSAAEFVARLNPQTTVHTLLERLTSDNALALFCAADIVIDGSDNFATRYLANDAAVLAGIPLVWGAVSQYGGQVGVAWADRGPHYRDLFPTPPPPGSVLSCEAGGVLPTVVSTIGSIMASEAIKILAGVGDPLVGRVIVMDALAGSFRELAYERDPLGEPVTELIDYELLCGVAPSSGDITPAELLVRLDDVLLLDVREPWEFAIASLPGAVLVPLGTLDAAVAGLPTDRPVVVYCHHGIRSANARDTLLAHGINAASLTGGIDAWSREIDPEIPRY